MTSALLLAAGLTVIADVAAPLPAAAAQDPTSCQGSVALTNGSFETPTVPNASYRLFHESLVPGWSTNDSRREIEIWGTGFQGVPAAAGRQFAELNANTASRLYQDVTTTPGQTLTWSLKHRGRGGVDVMRVLIGAPTGALVQNGPNLSDGTAAWGTHTGTYTVPAGQTVTRFAFEAVSAAGGIPGLGNFLDDITFGTGPCLITSKTVANLTRGGATAEVGDVLRYTVTTRNDGGNPALQSVSTDQLAAGIDYVPGSIRIISGAGAGVLTDPAGDDRGEFTAGDRTVRVRLGDGGTASAGGSIAAGSSTSYTFDARVNATAAAGTVVNEARVAFRDAVVNQNRTSTSQETVTPVNPAADLAITKTLNTSPLVAGRPASFTIGVTNNGPQTATGVTVTDAVPAGLTNVQATPSAGTCTVGATVSCALPDLAIGNSASITLTGTLSPSFDPGTALTNTASVSGSRFDTNAANNTATASGILTTTADVSVTKSFTPVEPVAGQNVTYLLTTHNAGPSEARDVRIVDPLDPEVTFVSADPDQGSCALVSRVLDCNHGVLAPGATVATRVVVEIATGASAVVQNSVSVTSSTSDPDPSNNVDSTSFQPEIVSDLAVAKSATPTEVAAGDAVAFTLAVSNVRTAASTSDAVNVVLEDTLPEGFTVTGVDGPADAVCSFTATTVRCTWATFAIDATADVVVSTVVAADAPEGIVTNTASVASPAEDPDTTNNSDSADVEVVQSADLSIVKTAPATGVSGNAFTYTLEVTNDGPSVARGVSVSDPLPGEFAFESVSDARCSLIAGSVGCLLGDLAPGDSITVQIVGRWSSTATGTITNTASAASATPDADMSDNTSSVDVRLVPSADLAVVKTTVTPTVPLGGQATFIVTVSNSGPSAAAGVIVSEVPPAGYAITGATPSSGTWSAGDRSWTVGTLLPGGSATLTVTGTVTAEGTLTNTATGTSQTPDPDPSDNTGTAVVQVTPSADLSIVKTSSVSPAALNGPLAYTIVVTNNGPSVAAAVAISDALPAGLLNPTTATTGCSIAAGELVCTEASLAVGATFTATVNGTVDPAFAAAELTNTATVSSATADPDPSDNTSTVVVPLVGTPRVELVKAVAAPEDTDGDGRIDAGDTVAYTFTIRNTGNVTLTGAQISDPLLGGAVSCAEFDAPLSPGSSVICAPVSYTLTQQDLDEGAVHNEASVVAASARGEAVDDAEAIVTIPVVNSVVLAKVPGTVIDVNGDDQVTAGDTITYTFTVTNTGTTTLSDVEIADPLLGGRVTCAAADGVTLEPGASLTCAPVSLTLTQDRIDDGAVDNTASVQAESPRGGDVSDSSSASADIERTAGIELLKTASGARDVNGDGLVGAGDTIEYSFTARNTGNTTITDVAISDPLLSDDELCAVDSLAVGGDVDCGPFIYTLTQADIEAQSRSNTATATGDSPLGPLEDEASAEVEYVGTAAVELTKTPSEVVDTNGDGMTGAGDTISYSFVVRNTGTTVLTDIALYDEMLTGDFDPVECAEFEGAELAPADELECGPIAYQLTQADIDHSEVLNIAYVQTESNGGPATSPAYATVQLIGTDRLSLLKSAAAIVDENGNGRTDAGDTIAYTFTVTNTGTTTLSDIAVTDPRLGGPVVCDETTLAPNDAVVCAGPAAVLTQAEVDAGEIVNTATASGIGTGDTPATATDTITTPITAQPAVALTKTGGEYADDNGNGKVDAGDSIRFRFSVGNTGAVTLTDITIDDPKLGGEIGCEIPDLAPGSEADCGPVGYTLTAADVAAGTVVNVATVRGTAGAVIVTAAATASVDVSSLATTGGVITGLGWALALLVVGALVLLIARARSRRSMVRRDSA